MKNEALIAARGKRPQKEVAAALNISISMYSALENNHRFPGKDLLKRITKYYGKTVEEIFFNQ